MKIVSKHKDYYDYYSTQYGVDNNVVYLRNKITLDGAQRTMSFGISSALLVPLIVEKFNVNFSHDAKDIQLRYLFVAGRQYPCIRKNIKHPKDLIDKWTPWRLYNPAIDECFTFDENNSFRWWRAPVTREDLQPKWNGQLVEVSRTIQQPVFFVDGYKNCSTFSFAKNRGYKDNGVYVSVNEQIPRLGELGFAAIFPAERLYQELDYYLSNTIKDNPDIVPPVIIANEDLIVSKGFDLKHSFRKGKESEKNN